MSNVLPIDKEMNDSSALWGDIQRFQMKEAKPVIPVIETPQSAAKSSAFSGADIVVLKESLKMHNINDKYMILRIVCESIYGQGIQAFPVPIEPLPAAPAPCATFAEVVGDEFAIPAARPVVSAPANPEKRMCPYGARCKFEKKGTCRNGGHPQKKPVCMDGKFFDKDDTRCRHDGGGKCCVYDGCVFAHETDEHGKRIHIKK